MTNLELIIKVIFIINDLVYQSNQRTQARTLAEKHSHFEMKTLYVYICLEDASECPSSTMPTLNGQMIRKIFWKRETWGGRKKEEKKISLELECTYLPMKKTVQLLYSPNLYGILFSADLFDIFFSNSTSEICFENKYTLNLKCFVNGGVSNIHLRAERQKDPCQRKRSMCVCVCDCNKIRKVTTTNQKKIERYILDLTFINGYSCWALLHT